jgi:hypothetical protein
LPLIEGLFFIILIGQLMKHWYESKIAHFDELANKEMMSGDIKKFMEYQKEANNYREMLRQYNNRHK